MFDYELAGGIPAGSRAAWSTIPLQPLTKGVLTPFSYSVLSEIVGRAWFLYFDRLGFDPIPRARVIRQLNGVPYLSLTLAAQRDTEQAGIEPITLRINGQPFPVCKWEKPGLIAGVKLALKARKVSSTLDAIAKEIDGVTQQCEEWYKKLRDFRWTQAEILMAMEEIEPKGAVPMTLFFAVRHQIDRLLNQLLRASQAQAPFPKNLRMIEEGLGALDNWNDPLASLDRSGLSAQTTVDSPAFQTFLAKHGHRSQQEGELRQPRWEDEPAKLFEAIQQRTRSNQPNASQLPALIDAVEANQRSAAKQSLEQLQQLLPLQNKTQTALSYLWAGTRRWALAAAREAMIDKRILNTDDIFFFEIEEIKQMMTGEWNISSLREIQATAEKRKSEFATWQNAHHPELLIGDAPAQRKA